MKAALIVILILVVAAVAASGKFVSVRNDLVTQREAVNAQWSQVDVALQRRATTDPLTGVANGTVLMDRLAQAIRRQHRASGLLAVLFLVFQAPDVTLSELAVGAVALPIILLLTLAKIRKREE